MHSINQYPFPLPFHRQQASFSSSSAVISPRQPLSKYLSPYPTCSSPPSYLCPSIPSQSDVDPQPPLSDPPSFSSPRQLARQPSPCKYSLPSCSDLLNTLHRLQRRRDKVPVIFDRDIPPLRELTEQ